MTGGMGRKNLTAFYRDHFVFWYVPLSRHGSHALIYDSNPPDTALNPISRVVGPDRVVGKLAFGLKRIMKY